MLVHRISNALTVQFCDLIKPYCERSNVVQWSRAQYEAMQDNEGLLLATSCPCTGLPGDTVTEVVAQFARNLELTGLRPETTAIYCAILVEKEATATSPVAHYQARVYEF
jgi:hypothetical protein